MVRHNTATRHIPIIMLTAVGGEAQRIASLDMGADDYVEKPFSSSEVVSRVRAVLRRSDPSTVEAGPVLNAAIRMQGPYFVVLIGTREVTVSRKEALLLDVLLGRENTLLGAEELIGIPGGEGSEVMLRELDCDVRSLRRKLENTGAGSIEVLPGFRYRLKSGR